MVEHERPPVMWLCVRKGEEERRDRGQNRMLRDMERGTNRQALSQTRVQYVILTTKPCLLDQDSHAHYNLNHSFRQ